MLEEILPEVEQILINLTNWQSTYARKSQKTYWSLRLIRIRMRRVRNIFFRIGAETIESFLRRYHEQVIIIDEETSVPVRCIVLSSAVRWKAVDIMNMHKEDRLEEESTVRDPNLKMVELRSNQLYYHRIADNLEHAQYIVLWLWDMVLLQLLKITLFRIQAFPSLVSLPCSKSHSVFAKNPLLLV